MSSAGQAEVHVAGPRHENSKRVTACGRRGLQLGLNQVCQNQPQIFLFDPTRTNRVVTIRATDRASAT